MKKRLTKTEHELFDQFWDEVSYVKEFHETYLCFPFRPHALPQSQLKDGEKSSARSKNQVSFDEKIEFAYAQIASELPQDDIRIDFIDGQLPFSAHNYHHALCLLLSPQEKEVGHFFFTKGFETLLERARKECSERSRQKKNSNVDLTHLVELLLLGDCEKQKWRRKHDEKEYYPAPLLQTELAELLPGKWEQYQVSRAIKDSKIFKGTPKYKAYKAWFRRETGQSVPTLPKDRNGRAIRNERVDESFLSLDEYENQQDSDIDQQWD